MKQNQWELTSYSFIHSKLIFLSGNYTEALVTLLCGDFTVFCISILRKLNVDPDQENLLQFTGREPSLD